MICAALGALGALAVEQYEDVIEAWLSEHGLSEWVEANETAQSMVEETHAAEEERNQPFAEEHPFIWGFINAFANSPPPSAMGMFRGWPHGV